MATEKGEVVKRLREFTGMGTYNCSKAYDYANGDFDTAVAYLKAKTLAVATPDLSFDERVQRFLELDRRSAKNA